MHHNKQNNQEELQSLKEQLEKLKKIHAKTGMFWMKMTNLWLEEELVEYKQKNIELTTQLQSKTNEKRDADMKLRLSISNWNNDVLKQEENEDKDSLLGDDLNKNDEIQRLMDDLKVYKEKEMEDKKVIEEYIEKESQYQKEIEELKEKCKELAVCVLAINECLEWNGWETTVIRNSKGQYVYSNLRFDNAIGIVENGLYDNSRTKTRYWKECMTSLLLNNEE